MSCETPQTDSTENNEFQSRVEFDDSDSRRDEMHNSLEAWVEQFAELSEEASASAELQEWLDVQSRFHDYSYRNTLLIKHQCPEATKVAGYNTWCNEFDRHVQEGESAIWIWAPIITTKCPECGNSPSYHENTDCEYDETPPEEWNEGLVGFKPVPVFDVSQTEGEPLPELDTTAKGEGSEDDILNALLEAAPELGVRVNLVPPEEWTHGEAAGVCTERSTYDCSLLVEVKDLENDAQVASVLAHEYAHALLHFDVDDKDEREKREVEAESTAYVVSQYIGLDASNSAFYVAAWDGDPAETIRGRLQRIVDTAQEILNAVELTQ
ncbi:ArdC-like ssDNA-binding domain-containing protein [Haloarchaeobius salinus]|uniref:ArdC-like ssDNA-binding domain-containing protein n=1 Tax=Haloarchaeobius salinus TaxID=1198298 RepID=UPI00210B7333|nr:ArdC-like ssDNA-binding domain-containing protein [Haloarchaeobius salinus]